MGRQVALLGHGDEQSGMLQNYHRSLTPYKTSDYLMGILNITEKGGRVKDVM